jgi:amino acid permease
LNFIGVRNNCLDIFGIADKINTAAKFNAFTIFVLSTLTVISCFVTDLGLISSVGGGTTVTLVCFVFPALMFCALIQNKSDHGTVGERLEALLVMVLMVIGVILGLIGVTRSIIRDDSE